MHRPLMNHARALLTATALLAVLACGGGSGTNLGGGGPTPPGGNGGGGSDGGVTISGLVLDPDGQPLANRTVLAGGISATTSASGAFTLTVASTPYDLTVVEPAPARLATVYAQLGRTDPKLIDLAASPDPTRSATLGGNLAGGDGLPTPSGERTAVSWGSPESSTGSYVTSSTYSFPVSWSGPGSTTGSVRALQWTVDGNGTVTGYRAHGVTSGVTLTDGNATTNASVLLSAPLTDTVSGTIAAPTGYAVTSRSVFLTFADFTYFPVSDDSVASTSFSFPVPGGIGTSVIVSAAATDGNAQTAAQLSTLQPGTTGAALTLPSPALPTSPMDGATGVDTSTDFVWTPVAGGIHLLLFAGNGSDPTYLVVTAGSRARIPDLAAQGLGLPSGHPYQWGLLALGPFAGIDAFAGIGAVPREGFGFRTITSIQFTTR